MFEEKGQAAIELIIIVVVLLGLLLATAIIITYRNADADSLYELQLNTLQCHSIASKVIAFNSNKGYSETYIELLEKDVHLENGNILISRASCTYSGEALKQTTGGPSPTYLNDTTPGFDLEKQKLFKVKKVPEGVAFCDGLEDWC